MSTTMVLAVLVLLGSGEGEAERERIRSHLELVETLLRGQPPPTDPRLASERARNLDALHTYWQRGNYPQNTVVPGARNPIFIDERGVACAAGALIIASGHEALARRISQTMNEKFLDEMHDAELAAWVAKSGLSLGELRLIQPSYAYLHERAFSDDLFEAVNLLDLEKFMALTKSPVSRDRLDLALRVAIFATTAAKHPDHFRGSAAYVTDGYDLVSALLEAGANPNALIGLPTSSTDRDSPLRVSALGLLKLHTLGRSDPKLETLLTIHGAKLTPTEALLVALDAGDCEHVADLLNRPGVNIDPAQHPMKITWGKGPLAHACALMLLDSPKVPWDGSWFQQLNEPEYIALLVKHGIKPRTPDELLSLLEVFSAASRGTNEANRGWAETIRSALETSTVKMPPVAKAGPDDWSTCPEGVNKAVHSGNAAVVDLYVKLGGPLSECGIRIAPLLSVRKQVGKLTPGESATMALLLGAKAQPYDSYGEATPLPWAASRGDLEFARVLLKTDPTIVDQAPAYGCTPLAIAAARDDSAMVSLLLENQADVHMKFYPSNKCGWPNKDPKTAWGEMVTIRDVKLSAQMRARLKLGPPSSPPESHLDAPPPRP